MNSHSLNSQIPYATPEELDFLRGHAAQLNLDSQVVMLGAGPGVMLLALKEGFGGLAVTVIDINTTAYAQKHLAAEGLDRNVRYIVSDSAMAANYWTAPDIDLLIIDGDHSYRGVVRDLNAWLPFVKPGGAIFLHDYEAEGTQFAGQERYPGVRQAVEERFQNVIRIGTAALIYPLIP